MAIIDVNNPPTEPDSSLDSDLALVANFAIQGASAQPIAPGDWVDGDPSYITQDPTWGFSYQVIAVDPMSNQVTVLMYANAMIGYEPTQMDGAVITANYRRVMN